jgi:hypothetical protein
MLSTLLSMSIPLLSSQADMLHVVEDPKTKKAWFEANQACVTAKGHHKGENSGMPYGVVAH